LGSLPPAQARCGTSPGGYAIWIGLASATAEIDGLELVRHEVRIAGSYAYTDADFEDAIPLATHVPSSWIETVSLTRAAERFIELASSPGSRPKTVIMPAA